MMAGTCDVLLRAVINQQWYILLKPLIANINKYKWYGDIHLHAHLILKTYMFSLWLKILNPNSQPNRDVITGRICKFILVTVTKKMKQ